MGYSKLAPWPFIDPESPPPGYLKIGESVDHLRTADGFVPVWHFFAYKTHLIICKKVAMPDDDRFEPYSIRQYEYPLESARWFVDTVGRFLLPLDHPQAVSRGEITVEEPVGGEVLGVTRGAGFGGPYTPGYSLDNLNRIEHSTIMPNGAFCEMFKMGDPWLFEDGLFDLFKEIATRH